MENFTEKYPLIKEAVLVTFADKIKGWTTPEKMLDMIVTDILEVESMISLDHNDIISFFDGVDEVDAYHEITEFNNLKKALKTVSNVITAKHRKKHIAKVMLHLSICTEPVVTVEKMSEVTEYVSEELPNDVDVTWGMSVDPELQNQFFITLLVGYTD